MDNKLTVFNSELIPVYVTEEGRKVVVGRELHDQLKINSKYADWFKNMCAYGFVENEDYTAFSENLENGGRRIEHLLTLDMAKHLAMIQRSPQGKLIRDKLISLETNVSELSPELRALINIELKQKQQDAAIADTNRRLDNIGSILALSPTEWRKEAGRLVAKIAQQMGGVDHIRDVYEELYRLVDERSGSAMGIRLTNMKRRQIENGACKSKVDKLNKLDVINEDRKLKEIFIIVLKELAIKHHVDL